MSMDFGHGFGNVWYNNNIYATYIKKMGNGHIITHDVSQK